MPKAKSPAGSSESPEIVHESGSIVGNQNPPAGHEVPSPEEGAALIRAFLQIEQREVRSAIIDLVARLSAALSHS